MGIVLSALPILVHPSLWVVLIALWIFLAVAIVVDGLSLRDAIPAVEAVAEAPRVGVGESASIALNLKREEEGSVQLWLQPETGGAFARSEAEEVRMRGTTHTHDLSLMTNARGPANLEAVWVRARGLGGFLERIRRVPVSVEVSVVPSLKTVRRLTIPPRGEGVRVGDRVTRRRGQGTEFEELQRYSVGMDTRAIDWKASARSQELRVRHFRLERSQRVVVAIDTGRAMQERIAGLSRLDHAIHTGLALAHVALRNGDLVGLQAYGIRPRKWVAPASGTQHMRKLTHACAGLDTDDRETNHVAGLRDVLSRLNRRSLIVVVSDLGDPSSAELLYESLGAVARKHLIVFVALTDPLTSDPLDEAPEKALDLSRAVVADDLRRARAVALEKIRARGVRVVSAPPGKAALTLLTRYLEVKRRGSL